AMSSISVLFSPAPASAHTGFESSSPVDGSTVGAAVEVVTIAFSGPAEPAGEGFVALDSSGTIRIPDGVTSGVEQQTWTLRFDPPLGDGAVGVRWTVQAPDAHPINGSFSFTVTASGAPFDDDTVTEGGEAADATSIPAAGLAADRSGDRPAREIASEVVDSDSRSASADQVGSSEAQELEEFLQRNEQAAPKSGGVGAFGRLLGFVGTMLGIGGLCFGAVVVHNHRRDLRSVYRAVRYAALVVIAGTAVDLAAHLAVASNGWLEIPTAGAVGSATVSTFGIAIGLRVVAGSLLFATARIEDQNFGRTERPVPRRELVVAGAPGLVAAGDLTSDAEAADRLHGGPSEARRSDRQVWPVNLEMSDLVLVDEPVEAQGTPSTDGGDRPFPILSLLAVILLLASFTFDGHTVTEGNRWVTGAIDMIHVVAASIWAGGVAAFAVVLWRRYRRRERLGGLEMALRFSVVAGVALAAAGLAGTILAVIILESVSDLWTTPWGRLLMAKTVAVAAAASLGTYNHFVVIPWMNAHPDDDTRSVRIRNTATGEAVLLAAVIVLTAFLVGAST
ncbi:MAG: copper resistance protein CopC/CopD, partial [Acidimicrobiia bacterium]|nr:copper resistance protein CopC/CopD [Acidimicrobiia bacterium]